MNKSRGISVFRHDVDENCVLLYCYAASSSNFVPTFRDNLSVPLRQYDITATRCVITQKSEILNSRLLTEIAGRCRSKWFIMQVALISIAFSLAFVSESQK